jgi:hypothetical protein
MNQCRGYRVKAKQICLGFVKDGELYCHRHKSQEGNPAIRMLKMLHAYKSPSEMGYKTSVRYDMVRDIALAWPTFPSCCDFHHDVVIDMLTNTGRWLTDNQVMHMRRIMSETHDGHRRPQPTSWRLTEREKALGKANVQKALHIMSQAQLPFGGGW